MELSQNSAISKKWTKNEQFNDLSQVICHKNSGSQKMTNKWAVKRPLSRDLSQKFGALKNSQNIRSYAYRGHQKKVKKTLFLSLA